MKLINKNWNMEIEIKRYLSEYDSYVEAAMRIE